MDKTVPQRWRKSSASANTSDCVELGSAGAIRDSKNSAGPTLRADLPALLAAVKGGRIG